MTPPKRQPIGLHIQRTARSLNRAFEDALAAAGGSLPTWLILLSLRAERWDTQTALAEAVGVRGPTLTHHLDRLERDGLITRTREPENRRVQRVELTDAGIEAFDRLRAVATSFDRRLRDGIADAEVVALGDLLDRLETNVADGDHRTG
jgi:MarR family transcriptional regulator, transcriptional regulator for hemolysin